MNKANQTNGCGAMTGWLRWVKPPHHEFFRSACELHDILYEHGGSEDDRKQEEWMVCNYDMADEQLTLGL